MTATHRIRQNPQTQGTNPAREATVLLRDFSRHPKAQEFICSKAKRKVARAGRRGAKTVAVATLAVEAFLRGRRVLYGTPTGDQIQRFWHEVNRALADPIEKGALYKNETLHIIGLPSIRSRIINALAENDPIEGNEPRIRAKTAWNAETLRGDFADLLILDEFQLMNEDTWEIVGAPMLLDNNGDAVFIYTPPSIRTAGTSKARDKRHAAKLFKRAQEDATRRWQAFHWTSHDNPFISRVALAEITQDMTHFAYEQEILAEDKEDNPYALWKREDIESNRVTRHPALDMIVVGVDPTNTSTGDECGIVVDGRARVGNWNHLYVLEDMSLRGTPNEWGSAVVTAFHKYEANYVVAEVNNGGEMVAAVIHSIDSNVPVVMVHASRGKATRAEPIAALYEKGIDTDAPPRGHHVGTHKELEDEMCQWMPGEDSPNRMDAHVWAATKLMLGREDELKRGENPLASYRG